MQCEGGWGGGGKGAHRPQGALRLGLQGGAGRAVGGGGFPLREQPARAQGRHGQGPFATSSSSGCIGCRVCWEVVGKEVK